MTVYGVGVGVCRKAHGEAASTKLNTRTHPYYDGIYIATPTAYRLQLYCVYPGYRIHSCIDQGQDRSDRGGRCVLRMKARVRRVNNLTPRSKNKNPAFQPHEPHDARSRQRRALHKAGAGPHWHRIHGRPAVGALRLLSTIAQRLPLILALYHCACCGLSENGILATSRTGSP